MSASRLGPEGLEQLRDELSGRDVAIVSQVADLRLMSGRQIEAVHFPLSSHENTSAASRACRRSLERLARERLVARMQRRVGGVRAGSGSFVYGLGPVGHRLLSLERPRPRYREPSVTFADHTLAIAQLVVEVSVAAREKTFDLLVCQAEPRCWRELSSMGARTTLRPDLFVSLGVGEFGRRWFCEVDNGTEHLPAVLRKCRLYQSYYQSGKEQLAHGVFPRVCWLVTDERRVASLRRAIDHDRRLSNALFVVARFAQATRVLAGETP
jgi:hypothetical protein